MVGGVILSLCPTIASLWGLKLKKGAPEILFPQVHMTQRLSFPCQLTWDVDVQQSSRRTWMNCDQLCFSIDIPRRWFSHDQPRMHHGGRAPCSYPLSSSTCTCLSTICYYPLTSTTCTCLTGVSSSRQAFEYVIENLAHSPPPDDRSATFKTILEYIMPMPLAMALAAELWILSRLLLM